MDKVIESIEVNKYFNDKIKNELVTIYKESQNTLSGKEKTEIKKRVDDILEEMFRTAYSYSIPMEFINSPIGEYLLRIKLDMTSSIVYGIAELVVLSKKSKAMIFNDYNSGKLVGVESGKRRLIVTEEAAIDYLTSVGRNPLEPEEAKNRILMFNKMLRQGYDLSEIKKIMWFYNR